MTELRSTVCLTPEEFALAANGAVTKAVLTLTREAKAGHGLDTDLPWDRALLLNVKGNLAEMALSKLSGTYWTGAAGWNAPDTLVGQVRTTEHMHGHLLLHPQDADDARHVLVIARAPWFRVAGWILGRDGKRDIYWETPPGHNRPCFMIPQSDLTPGWPS